MIRMIGTMFGSGNSPIMPGTCGSIVALLMVMFIPAPWYSPVVGTLAILATVTGPPLARRFMAQTGGKDPQDFVYDEAAGLWIAIWRPTMASPATFVLGFLLFRLFDMWKPGPIRKVEKWTKGYGVVYDDVLAGLIALGIGWLIESVLL
ncbi:MAG: phosphatidylglycerophosphatase A [Planctomycetota bacterium]|jgi:phosphatidylglycerophosphatase A